MSVRFSKLILFNRSSIDKRSCYDIVHIAFEKTIQAYFSNCHYFKRIRCFTLGP